jgi:hypothetical protein
MIPLALSRPLRWNGFFPDWLGVIQMLRPRESSPLWVWLAFALMAVGTVAYGATYLLIEDVLALAKCQSQIKFTALGMVGIRPGASHHRLCRDAACRSYTRCRALGLGLTVKAEIMKLFACLPRVLMIAATPSFAAVEQCRHIKPRTDREACYDRQSNRSPRSGNRALLSRNRSTRWINSKPRMTA